MPFDDAGLRPELKNPNAEELRIVDQMIAVLGREGGWTQGSFKSVTGLRTSYCLLGALGEAEHGNAYSYRYGSTAERSRVLDSLARAVSVGGVLPTARVQNWNDRRARRQGDVLDLLRRVRAELE